MSEIKSSPGEQLNMHVLLAAASWPLESAVVPFPSYLRFSDDFLQYFSAELLWGSAAYRPSVPERCSTVSANVAIV